MEFFHLCLLQLYSRALSCIGNLHHGLVKDLMNSNNKTSKTEIKRKKIKRPAKSF
jgi:hypothetical protein